MDKLFGIPVYVTPHIPNGELWLVSEGETTRALVHEGKDAGKEIETVVKEAQVIRMFNFGTQKKIEVPVPKFPTKYSL